MQRRFRQSCVAIAATIASGSFGTAALGAPNPDRDAYFGETHVHTSWSLDAWLLGNRVTGPADAYKASGQVATQAKKTDDFDTLLR